MANITILEALNRSLTATKKYVDDNLPHYNETLITEISGDDYSSFMNNNYFNMSALNIDETKSYIAKNKFSINEDEEYTFKFVYDKEADALINEDNQLHIYNHKSYNGTNLIEDVNSAVLTDNNNITPMITMSEYNGYFRLYEIDKVEIDNKYLPDDLNIKNSLTVGNRIGETGQYSVAEGYQNAASSIASHAEGSYTTASSDTSHAEGYETTASGQASHAEGFSTTASSDASHAEGSNTEASGESSHAEGGYTTASGVASHAEGESSNLINAVISNFSPSTTNDDILTAWNTNKFSLAKGEASHVEGKDNLALGDFSHAEGTNTTASGYTSHAEGNSTTASGNLSHAEGDWTVASGYYSHAEGTGSTASGEDSHAEGKGTKASSGNQHVQGKYNIEDTENKYAHIVGNGTSNSARSNAHTLDWQGNAWYKGKISQEGTPTEDKDLVTKKYVDEKFLPSSAIHTMTLKLNTNEVNFIQSMETNNYNNPLEHITKGDLSLIIDNSIETIIFEGLERYPYKVVGAYRGFNNIEHVLLELAITDSEDDFYAVHRLKIIYSNDFNRCFLSSFYGDFGKINALNVDNTIEYEPTGDYNPATKKYVDDKVAEANASGGYTHPDSHPASMITGLATVATSGSYNDLNDKPTIPIKTSELTNDSGFTTKKYVDEHDDHLINIINGGLPLKLNVTQEELESIINLTDNTYTILSSISPDLIKSVVNGDDWYSTLILNNDFAFSIKSTGNIISSITCIESSDIINMQYTNSVYRAYNDNELPFIDVSDSALCVITSPDGVESVAFAKGVPKRYDMATKKYVDDNKFSGNYNDLTNKPIIPSEYNLPIASQTTLGGIKVGAGLSITAEGVLSATGGGTADSVNWENVVGKPTIATVATTGSYNDLTDKPTIPTKTSQLTNDSGFITSIPAEYITDTYLNNKLSSMPKSLAGHDGAQVLSYIDKHNVLERENMVDKAFQVFTSLFYSTSIPTSGDISNLNVNVVDFVNTIMNACTEFGEDIFLYFDFIFDSPIKFVVMPSSSSNMFLMIIDNGKTSVGLQIEFTGDGTGQYTRTSTELVSSNKIATVATSGNYNDLTNKPTIPTVTNDLTNELKANYDAAYTHSTSAHAPVNAQKNSDITKAEIEAKLTGNITSHIHSQYLTEHQSLNGYAKTADLATVATSGSYNDLTNKPTIPTVTNDLTNTLKSNYDTAYAHSQAAHAPSNAQKNSDITKSEIEAKLTGDITSHTHSQYLTEHQSLDGYVKTTDLSTVATTGSYNDLTDKPTIPSAYTHPSTHPASMITGLSKVATSGSYNDLSNKPTIPTIPNSLPANGGNADTVNNFRLWKGTQAQYDAITTKNPNTIYLITG